MVALKPYAVLAKLDAIALDESGEIAAGVARGIPIVLKRRVARRRLAMAGVVRFHIRCHLVFIDGAGCQSECFRLCNTQIESVDGITPFDRIRLGKRLVG
ncbi:hypothetical protein ADT26_08645 [Xanthomonas oryzae]|nr:hypothetical protein AXO1947_14910 [Xanthomonas oryzae pv. oryzae]KOR44846.1 hypothetical protein ADT26_08645 [Xanthomonas oryzae]